MKSIFPVVAILFLPSFVWAENTLDSSNTDSEIFELEPFTVDEEPVPEGYYDETLRRYGLERNNLNNSIRFLWLRSFHVPMLFQAFDGVEEVLLVAKTYNKETHAWEDWKTKKFSRSEHLEALKLVVDYYKFYEEPFSISNSGYDGSSWFVEANIDGKYHVVYRWSPEEDTLFYKLGYMFIESMMEPPLAPIY